MEITTNILESTIQLQLDEIPIDYHIQFDFTGKVYAFHPLIFDLPEAAQKMILGEDLLQQRGRVVVLG